ncbi:tetratricopeptide repeat protein [Facilibium subflavum]|uniref:tetratricopeptide repeat protein n=1 Tax=Facilibium subflavum TaxID=2219058 RepID=UPI000E6515A1|nr:tetratricopeptide repeat protein [Facilibium subflavum]
MKRLEKFFIAFLGVVCFKLSTAADVDNLQLQVTKLSNQVNYLIEQQNKNDQENISQQLNELRGQIQLNSYKINQLNQVVTQKLKDFDEKLSMLEKEVNKPSAKQLKLQHDNAAFSKAKQAVLNKQYQLAETNLKQYLKDFYNGEHYSESLYLLGQVYLIQNKPKDAYQQFKTIVTRYPKSIKIAQATYSLGLLEMANGNTEQGKDYLKTVVKKYPQSQVAKKAQKQLQSL